MLTLRKRQQLLTALLEDYPEEYIDGYVIDARIDCHCLSGYIYKALGYDNGELFTADVECIVRYARRYVVRTHHAAYLIVNFHPQGGRRALCETLAIFTRGTALSTPLTRQ
ncbi:hypothetical protein OFL47_06230 [Pseudomonas aeruginosa]|uniref:hypothetical protein n=1 Tax=Pseudomonas aeruginosa TaxID=287 RepID=UPI0021F18FA3|nr:hypothetical protein [Pseudomonas aeruginosa]MCV6336258.1 hypothetical protein [Pseudomonas aeruginosa]